MPEGFGLVGTEADQGSPLVQPSKKNVNVVSNAGRLNEKPKPERAQAVIVSRTLVA